MSTDRGPKDRSSPQTWTGFLDSALTPEQGARLSTKIGIYADVAVASIDSIRTIAESMEEAQPTAVFEENLEKIQKVLDQAIDDIAYQLYQGVREQD